VADSFKVIYLKSVKDATQTGFLRYRNRGLEGKFIQAAQTIDSQLRLNPRQFGDPCFSYADLKLDVFVRAVQPLVVYYGVHQVEQVVMVHRLLVLDFGGHPNED
jgi:hypothetical protein